MYLTNLRLVDGGLQLTEGIDHDLESPLLGFLRYIVLKVAVGVGLLPHRVGKQKGHLISNRPQELQRLHPDSATSWN